MEKSTIFRVLQGMGDEAQGVNAYIFQQAQQLLQEADIFLSDGLQGGKTMTWVEFKKICQIVSLGYTCSGNSEQQEIEKSLFRSLKHFLSQQAGMGEALLAAVTRQGENIKYLIGAQGNVVPLLCASYGGVQAEEAEHQGMDYKNHIAAHIQRFPDIEDDIAVMAEYETYCSWIDRVASAYLAGDYCVRVSCMPVSRELLQKQYNQAAELYNKLSRYKVFEWNAGYNSGSNSSKNAIVFSGGDSEGTSSQLSGRSENYHVCQMLTRLACEMKRLYAAKGSGGYQVRIDLSAEKKGDMEALYAILSGALAEEHFILSREDGAGGWLLGSELCYVMQLPSIAFPGFDLHKNRTDVMPHPFQDTGVALGRAFYNGMPYSRFSIPPEQFNRHAFVCGMTGAGKTNTIFSILTRINLPFLVIEPVKGEYKELKREMPDLKVYTMNAADGNTLRLNPFWFPKGSNMQYHIDALKSLIISSFSLTAAMPNIIEQCINNVYFHKGWNTATGRNLYEGKLPEQYLYPTFNDLKQEVEDYLQKSKYVGETLATYQGALLTRLSSYTEGLKGMLLNVTSHPDFSEWEKENIVIELDMLSEDADKAVVMGSVLLQYFQYLKLKSFGESTTLSHLLIIEEAHRLFKNVDTRHQDLETADPQTKLVETLSNLMAEIRAYGEGIIVADQSPAKIAADVIRNSNIKLVHRLDMQDDIELVQNALLLDGDKKMFSQLHSGQALIRFESMKAAALVQVELYKGGTSALAKGSGHGQAPVVGSRSPVADFLLGNTALQLKIGELADRMVRSVLYDDLNNMNDWFYYAVQQLQYILSTFGYTQRECNFTSDVFNDLLIAGIDDAIGKDPVFGNQFVFSYHLKMLFERALQFFTEDKIRRREAVLFFHFRQVRLLPALKDILKYRRSDNMQILHACSQCVPYMELLSSLAELYEHMYTLKRADLESGNLEAFVSKELKKLMVPPVSSMFLSEISRNLSMLLRTRV